MNLIGKKLKPITGVSMKKSGMSEIEAAEKRLRVQLNYGGIVHDPADHKLVMEYRQGDLSDEIGQMRRLASAFNELADALLSAHRSD